MKIAVTGYTGFLGRTLLQELLKTELQFCLIGRSHPTNFSNRHIQFSLASDPNDIELEDVDVLIHCAGLAHQKTKKAASDCDDQKYWATNVQYTEKIMQLAVNCNIKKIIFISTIKVNCSVSSDNFIDNTKENFLHSDIYAKTKFCAENVVKVYAEKNGIDYIIFRPCVMYGEGHKGNLKRFENIFSKNKLVILPLKNCINKRSFLSVTDFCQLLIIACTKKTGSGIYLVSDDEAFSTLELAKQYADKYKTKFINFSLPKWMENFLISNERFGALWSNLNAKLTVDNTKTKSHFDWEPKQSVLSYIKEHKIVK